MDAPKFDKSRLPSRHVTEGPERAPHRSYFYAMGLGEAEIHQPFVGVATCWNEAAPCNIALSRQAQAVKLGVKQAMGTPREFTTITVTDGIAMGHEGMRSSLASRDAIADTVELTMRGHCYDALVGLAGCDKSLPGMMMAMVRLNVPSVFIYGGSILPGRAPAGAAVPADFANRDLTVQDMFEAVGRHQAGTLGNAALDILERIACPSSGACGGQFTANTMACVSEAIGLALLNSSGAPAPYESRDHYSTASGIAVMRLLEKKHPRPRRGHPQEPGECRAGRRVHRRLDQRRPAPAGDRPRGRHRLHAAGRLRHLPRHSLFRRPEAGRKIRRQGPLRGRRRAGGAEGTDARRPLAHRVHDRERAHHRRGTRRHPRRGGRPGDLPGRHADHQDRRRRRPDRQPRARGRHREGRGHVGGRAGLHRPGAGLRVRGGLLRRSAEPQLPGRRRPRHPQRGPQGRPRHARDALHHRRPLRPGHGQEGGADHRRPLLRRHPRLLRRPRRPGGGARRPDRRCSATAT